MGHMSKKKNVLENKIYPCMQKWDGWIICKNKMYTEIFAYKKKKKNGVIALYVKIKYNPRFYL